MAKKTKRRRSPVGRAPTGTRQPAAGARPPGAGPAAGASARPGSPAPSSGLTTESAAAPAPRRGVERREPGAVRRPVASARGARADAAFEPLAAEDAAIPFDRVPYVPSDLRRVGVMAAVMVVLIIIANLLIAHLTG